MLRRLWLIVLLSALVGFAAPAAATAQDRDDNIAVEGNTRDGSTQIDIDFDLVEVLDGIVDQTNLAVAYASCEHCTTIAVAIQVVLVNSPVEVLAPQNIAVAVNDGCVTCVTVAIAWQLVIGEAQRLEFTKEARKRLRQIAKDLRRLERSGGTADEVVAGVNDALADLVDVLQTGLVPAGPLVEPGDDDDGRDEDDDDDEDSDDDEDDERPSGAPDAEAAPAPSASPTPGSGGGTPTATPTPEPTATATPEPTATPTPTATPEPTPTATP